jgi:hypothetical protein
MADIQELFATKHSAGRDDRDVRALSWTVGSLTEGTELEPLLEGIVELLSNRERRHGRERGSDEYVIQNLLFDQEIALLDRIIRLLSPPYGRLTSERRNKHDIVCIKAIAYLFSIIRPTDTRCYGLILSLSRNFARPFAERPAPDVSDVTSAARSGRKIIVAKLQKITTAMMRDRTTNVWYSNQVVVALLQTLEDFDCMDFILGIIPAYITLFEAPSLQSSSSHSSLPNGPPVFYEDFIQVLRNIHIPRYLDTYTPPGIHSSDRVRHIMACLKAMYVTTDHFDWTIPRPAFRNHDSVHTVTVYTTSTVTHTWTIPPKPTTTKQGNIPKKYIPLYVTVRCLAELRDDDEPSIAHYVNCVTSHLACHLIGDLTLQPNHNGDTAIISEHIWQLNMLCAWDKLDGTTQPDLWRELYWYLRIGCYRREMLDRLSAYRSQMSAEELESLDKFQLRSTGGIVSSDLALPQKVFLSQGHTMVLISFLHCMRSPTMPEDILGSALNTLQLITRNMTACFSSALTQQHLVDLGGEVIDALLAEIVRRIELDSVQPPVAAEPISATADDASSSSEDAYPNNWLSPGPSRHLEPIIIHNHQRHSNPSSPSMHLEPRDVMIQMVQTLLHTIGTVAHPTSVGCAKQIIQAVVSNSTTPETISEAAENSLQKVCTSTS